MTWNREETAIALPEFDSSVRQEAGYCRLPFVGRNPPPSDIPLPVCSCISTVNHRNRSNVNSPFNAILVGVLLMLDFGHPILFNEMERTDDHICRCFHFFKRGDRNEGLYDEKTHGKARETQQKTGEKDQVRLFPACRGVLFKPTDFRYRKCENRLSVVLVPQWSNE